MAISPIELLRASDVAAWNRWRAANRDRRPNLGGANLTDVDLTDVDLTDVDLTRVNFTNATLVRANFTNATLAGANLTAVDLTGANLFAVDLASVYLTRANLNRANLNRANLFGANLAGATLVAANLVGANLVRANLAGATLVAATLAGANLTRATFISANLSSAILAGVNLTDADLTDAELVGAELAGANLTAANLRNANFAEADLTDAEFAGAELAGTVFASAKLSRAAIAAIAARDTVGVVKEVVAVVDIEVELDVGVSTGTLLELMRAVDALCGLAVSVGAELGRQQEAAGDGDTLVKTATGSPGAVEFKVSRVGYGSPWFVTLLEYAGYGGVSAWTAKDVLKGKESSLLNLIKLVTRKTEWADWNEERDKDSKARITKLAAEEMGHRADLKENELRLLKANAEIEALSSKDIAANIEATDRLEPAVQHIMLSATSEFAALFSRGAEVTVVSEQRLPD
ncbi:pentapeptide repeat-containing protein [Gordonia sp. CPCC 205515]|uniref:pentapeptide repeat-containing protein n=1 Tax=Gordonia sp. CPCC 205515 TaxID=3140791 RepID=UPI003AF370B1